jgi:hypothetical protein
MTRERVDHFYWRSGKYPELIGGLRIADHCKRDGSLSSLRDLREAAKPEPVSMGLIIDFTTNTVAGFERVFPSFSAARVKIIVVDSTSIGFSGTDPVGATIFGTVDRITGDVEAATEHWNHETNILQWATSYSLKCKLTQRMF